MTALHHISTRLPEPEFDELAEAAERNGRSIASETRLAIKWWLMSNRPQGEEDEGGKHE